MSESDYPFRNNENYRISLRNTAHGEITADDNSEVRVITDTTTYSIWTAKISGKNVSLLNDQTQGYLQYDGGEYLDAKPKGSIPSTHVKFHGDAVHGYHFTITDGENAVEHVDKGTVVKLRTVGGAGDRFYITDLPSKL